MNRFKVTNTRLVYAALSLILLFLTLLPLTNHHIMEGGLIPEWVARIEELSGGFAWNRLYLFPSVDTFMNSGIYENAMNSNLWLLLPGFLYHLTKNMLLSWRFLMVALQLGTLLTATLFFRHIFSGEHSETAGFFGVLLYMTCPYRIFLCYDMANLFEALAWMLLPLYARAITELSEGKRSGGKRKLRAAITAAVALAGIGYADMMFFAATAAVSVLLCLMQRKPMLLLPILAGSILFAPGILRLISYLFLNDPNSLQLPLQSIMKNGYLPGQFFSTYAFRDSHPGMGLGLLLSLLCSIWLSFVENQKKENRLSRYAIWLALPFTVLSLQVFPWDVLQRLGGWALRFISLIHTPAFFWGLALIALTLPAADSVGSIRKHENKLAATALPLLILAACCGVCLYQCHTLMVHRAPLLLP